MATVKDAQWQRVRGRIQEAWGALTDDDLDRTEGKLDQLIATIKEKTGDAADKIETKLKKFMED